MIFNVRGTHGSGKTTISQRLLNEHPHEELIEPSVLSGTIRSGKKIGQPYEKRFKLPNAFPIVGGVVLVGRRQAGLDGYLPHETIEDTIRYWAATGQHLVFENVLLSANIGRWGILFKEIEEQNHVVMTHLDTPWDVCQARVLQRRADGRAAGKKYRQTDAELNTDAHLYHWKRCRRTATRAAQQGFDVRWVDYHLAYELVHDALVDAGWDCPVHGRILTPDQKLETWCPTESEAADVIKTTRLPWEASGEGMVLGESPRQGHLQLPVETNLPRSVASVDTLSSDPLLDLGDPFDI